MAGEAFGRQLDGGDQLIGGQQVVTLWLIARQTMEVCELDSPLAGTPFDMHHGIQRSQRHAHVRRVRGNAIVTGAEDRVVAIQAITCGATGAGLALVARHAGVVEVIATGALQQVTARAGHVAQLRRGTRQHGLAQQRITRFDQRVIRKVGVAHQRTDHQPARRRLADIAQRQAGDINQVLGLGNVFFHQVEQIGAARNKACGGPAKVDGRADVGRLAVGKRVHEFTSGLGAAL
ncbi:sensory box/GGDEF domain/EAL domain-containing protein [Pseudomonas syringae pv. spinaceae]|uniref:Sensory box/GGDEF domain/EAL domain-containing protein n=1 Tax=Pseudomonas syringae pv. spinaceae TaxID=264459 RepID=A0A0Q0DXT7_PSESX|nr:sensory box/GGDEF domain/EAL domain-containing protein [Pseudomonas syringae pv. spinaceae]